MGSGKVLESGFERKAVGADKITPFDSRELMKNYIYNYIIVLNL